MVYTLGSTTSGWKRRGGASVYRPAKKYKKATYRKKHSIGYKTTVYKDQAHELKRYGRSTILSLGQSAQNTNVPRVITPFTGLDQGVKASERLGNQINAKSISIRGILRTSQSATATMLVRIMFLYNRRVANGTITSGSDLLLSSGVPVALEDVEMKALYLPTNNQHYKIISDQVIKLGTETDNADNVKIFSKQFVLNHLVRYDNDESTNIDYGNLQMVCWAYPANGAPDATTSVQFDCEATMYFTD